MTDAALGPRGSVVAVARCATHRFSKECLPSIRLLAGLGVEGDAHCGATVKHRSRVARDPSQPNLRQVHLVHEEILRALRIAGFPVEPGTIGENITTRGIDLLSLPTDTELSLGSDAVVRITGLRNPCAQLDAHAAGLLEAVIERRADGSLVRKAGIMAVVLVGGEVRPGDAIVARLPPPPHRSLDRV